MQQFQNMLRIGVADPVEYRLGLLAGGDQIVLTQFSEVLRKGGLAQPDALRQIADGQLAFLGQEAEDQQARIIAHHFQQSAGLAGLAREISLWSPSVAHTSAEHPSELQSHMRISYTGYCLKQYTTLQHT